MEMKRGDVLSLNDATANFFEHLSQVKKWQEEQVQKLRSMQKAQYAQLQEGQKRMDKLLNCGDDIVNKQITEKPPVPESQASSSSPNIDSPDTAEHFESTPSGSIEIQPLQCDKHVPSMPKPQVHQDKYIIKGSDFAAEIEGLETEEAYMQHTVSSLNKDAGQKKPMKRDFLKKREGIRRIYCPKKKAPQKKTTQRSAAQSSSSESRLATRLTNRDTVCRQEREALDHWNKNLCVKFKEPVVVKEASHAKTSHSHMFQDDPKKDEPRKNHVIGFDNIKLKESRELAEFESLEHEAQNTSCSDSSFIQKVLSGESQKVINNDLILSRKPSKESQINVAANTRVEEPSTADAKSRRPVYPKYIEVMEERVKWIKQKLSSSDSTVSDMSSPEEIGVYNKPRRGVDGAGETGYITESATNIDSSSILTDDLDVSVMAMCGPDSTIFETENDDRNAVYEKHNVPVRLFSDSQVEIEQKKQCYVKERRESSPAKSKMELKLKEVEEEMDLYKNYNKQLALLIKEKGEEIKALKKNRDEHDKFIKEEKTKLEEEIKKKREQIKREKQTFERYQKLRGDYPGKKEREESNVLRQQINTLQDDLKKLKIRSNSEEKRLRKMLDAAEKERDILKFENNRLKDHKCDQKVYEKRHTPIMEINKLHELDDDPKVKKICDNIACRSDDETDVKKRFTSVKGRGKPCVTQEAPEKDEPVTKNRVRFNLEPEVQKFSPEDNKNDFEEIQHNDKVERIYKTGEVEVIFTSGTRQYVSADGLHMKFDFFNGDTKEIFPDKRVVYTVCDGRKETTYPDGMIELEFPNLQIEQHYPDGMKKIFFKDGVHNIVFPDGTEETHFSDGITARTLLDGTEIIEYPTGEKEIRSQDYLRKEYNDGTVKTVYKSGRTETHYSSGRVRIRDQTGKVIVDTKIHSQKTANTYP